MKYATKFIVNFAKGLPIFQYLAVFSATLNMLCCGLNYGWPSPSLPKLLGENTQIPMTNDQGSWIATIFLIGILCGSSLGAPILDRLGRKTLILLTSGPFFASFIMVAYARSIAVLLVARFMAGMCDGLMIGSLPLYIGEIADPKIRGFLGSCVSTIMIFGILLMNILGSYLTIKTTALICSVVPILLLLTFSWMPESPYYLIMKGNLDEAKRSLQIFKGAENVDEELNRLKDAVEQQTANSGRYMDLFTVKSNRKALFIILGANAFQQLSGTTAIAFYAQTIFKEAGDSISPSVASIIYFSMQLIFCSLGSAIVDRTGRRPLMIISIIGTSLTLLIEACFFYIQNKTNIDTSAYQLVPMVALVCFVIIFSMGLLVIPIVLAGELFPTNVKAFAMSFSNSYFAIVTTIVAKFFQITKDKFGIHVPFFVFTACSIVGLVFVIFCVPETKGKTLEQINRELVGEPPDKVESQIRENFRKIDVY